MTAMRKCILFCSFLIAVLLVPAVGDPAYRILLKNGGQFSTLRYWEENQLLKFDAGFGVMGIEKNQVKAIETYTIDAPEVYKAPKAEKRLEEAEEKPEKAASTQTPPVEIDLKAFQDKMAKLKADLNKSLTRIRKANANKDLNARNQAMEDNRNISAEMWKLTHELEQKNNGKLPADWWEGVGREEPAP